MTARGFYRLSVTTLPGVSVETEDVLLDGQVRSTVIVDDENNGDKRVYQYWHEVETAQQAQEAHYRVVSSVEQWSMDLHGPSRIRLHPTRGV
jgi:hypothetical protein